MLLLPKIIAIVAGSLFIAIGINFFLVPFKVLDGGMIGLMIILCSLPIFIIAWYHNRVFVYDSIIGMLVSSFMTDLFVPLQYHFLYYIKLSPFTSSVIGGFLVGTGIGMMLRYETSTGGTDLLAQFLSKRAAVNVGILIFIMDGIIIGMGGLLISAETFFHSILTIFSGSLATSLITFKSSR